MLEEGRRLFLAQGYATTSVDSICEAAGVTKGAFFHHFTSKDDFAADVLAFTWEPVLEAHAGMGTAGGAIDRLEAHVRFMIEWVHDIGRLVPHLAQQLAGDNQAIREQIRGYFATWMGYLDGFLADAVSESGVEVDATALKEFIVATTEGVPIVTGQFGDQALTNVTDHLVAAVTRSVTI